MSNFGRCLYMKYVLISLEPLSIYCTASLNKYMPNLLNLY